ncbi:DUF4139 domain-containing protein [Thalassospira australica]|uniref:DUF4139 domain-containing protein n=1 Tax=Thalassospira australica TaxID=1528106 RepID=UPI00051A4728|nr:DUF4139 domain-containing protein [Thalassospira australica]
MSAALRNRFALAALLGSTVFFGPDIHTAQAQTEAENTRTTTPSIAIPASNRTKLQLTVYPGNLSLIAEQRNATIPEGQNLLRIGGLPQTIMDESFLLGTSMDSDLVWTSIRNRVNGKDSIDSLLRDQVGKTVTIRRGDDLIGGTLLAVSHIALVQTDLGVEQVPLDQVIVADLPDGFTAAPTLDADIATTDPLDHVSMAYLLGGIGWNTSYVAYYNSAENSLNLAAIAKVINASGSDFDDAQLRLVAGDPNRVSQPPMVKSARTEMMMSAMADGAASAAEAPGRESFENLHVYGPFGGLSMKDGDTVIVPLMDAQTLTAERHAIFEAASNPYNMGQNGGQGFIRPNLEIKITNTGGADEETPWPDGTVRIFANTPAGDTGYLSEDHISLTPVGRDATLRLGKASELSGTRDVTAFSRKSRPNLPDEVTADVSWTITNTSDRAETVTIRENLPTDWEVTSQSHKHDRPEPGLVTWEIEVPADDEVTVNWSVASTR